MLDRCRQEAQGTWSSGIDADRGRDMEQGMMEWKLEGRTWSRNVRYRQRAEHGARHAQSKKIINSKQRTKTYKNVKNRSEQRAEHRERSDG
jgi:hypothetical protein